MFSCVACGSIAARGVVLAEGRVCLACAEFLTRAPKAFEAEAVEDRLRYPEGKVRWPKASSSPKAGRRIQFRLPRLEAVGERPYLPTYSHALTPALERLRAPGPGSVLVIGTEGL